MKKLLLTVAAAAIFGGLQLTAFAGPNEDLKEYRAMFMKKFPGVSLQEFSNGVYAIDKQQRANWEQIEEFPPYGPYIDQGQALFEKPFKNGKSYADCLPNKPPGTPKTKTPGARRAALLSERIGDRQARQRAGMFDFHFDLSDDSGQSAHGDSEPVGAQ